MDYLLYDGTVGYLGHSGEVLVDNGKLFGLLSRHSTCKNPTLPTYYTSISKVRRFIDKITVILKDSKKKKTKKGKKGGNDDTSYYVGVSKKGGKIICGGALLSPDVFLTASQCIHGGGSFEAHVNGKKIAITKFKALSKTKKGLLGWLFGKLFGRKKGKSSRLSIKPIALPKKNEKYKDGSQASIVGYGLLNKGSKPSKTVMVTHIPLLNEKQCKGFVKLEKKTLCAGNQKTGSSPCKGDLGGPVVLNKKLIGMVTSCPKKNGPLVFSDIRPVVETIQKEMKTL